MTSLVEGFALSPQQERLWQLQEEGMEGSYRAFCAVRIAGDLDPERLRQALGRVVERHEILRTGFQRIPGLSLPLQVIGGPLLPPLDRHDLTRCPDGEREERIDGLLREMARLSEGGLQLRAALVDLPDGPRLLLGLPALCADTAGMESLAREVERAYDALAQALPGPLSSEETLQYADLSGWLNDLLESQDPRARKYWQSRDVRPLLEVRLPFARGASGVFAPCRRALPLPRGLAAEIAGLAGSREVPVSAVLLAAWTVLLQRLAGQPVAVATVFDGRRSEELQDAIGLLARHLPVQVTVAEQDPFEEVVRRTAKAVAELSLWQDFFDWKVVVGGNGAPYFLPFAFESRESPLPGSPRFALERCGARFDRFNLKLWCRWDGERLAVDLEHDAGTIAPEDAARVGAWFREQLQDAVSRPAAVALGLEILPVEERERLEALRGDRHDFGPERTLAELFAEQASRTPDRVALACGDVEISFAELRARAGRLARRLRRVGVGPDVKVALAAERSVEMVVGLLGILEAGGAYVPVDPSYPESRRAFLLEDAGALLLLTQERLLGRDEPGTAGEIPEPPPGSAGPDNLAYVIYTSGSTGRPKGVGISHRAIANRLLWMQRAFPLAADDRVLLKTPHGFDASVWEIFLPLITGARLVVAAPEAHRDPAVLLAEIERHGVTVLQLVPSLLTPFLEQPGATVGCRTLRRLFCGGEALPSVLAARAAADLGVEVCNLYGPTEVAIDATFRPGSPDAGEGIVPIGRPLDNVELLLLDRSGWPVPPGLAGEIHVGGPGLARGYLGRPDLTAGRFVPHPGAGRPGERVYRTGDLGLLAADGEVHFLGRVDQQVKIRGVRVELGEIEAALLCQLAVREAAAVVREDGGGGPRLVAYVVLRTGEDGTGLREAIARELPEAMVPASVVALGELPRLPNGKLDRAALPAPEQVRPEAAPAYVAPRTPVEEILAGIWSEALGVERAGVHDSFFELGGHSLIATRVIARVREAFEVELSVRKLFEAPTLAGLAGEVERALRSAEGLEAPAIGRAPRDGDLPLSFPQQRLWFLQQLEPESPAYNIPGALRLSGGLDHPALARAIASLVERHEALRTVFRVAQGEPIQVVLPAAGWEVPRADLSGLPEDRREEAVLAVIATEAVRPFDLSTGPLLRTLLLRLSGRAGEEHVLFFNLHHIVSDGWSVALLVRELSALYTGGRSGEAPRLPELPVQYADYACWQRGWLQGEVLERQLDYWRQRLAGAPEVLNLPADRPHPASQTYRGGARVRTLPGELCASLRALSRQASVTLFTTLLAAFKVLLLRYGAGEDLVVGTNAANRTRREVEGLIGFFVNSLVLRTGLAGDPGFREALARVRETVLGAFAHQDLPFDRIVEELQPRRDLSVTPLFQVAFDMDPAGRVEPLELAGLEIVPVTLPHRTAKFDLNLTLGEREEGVEVVAEYSADILDASTVDRLLGHFENLLQSVAAGPEERLGALALLGEEEIFQLLHEVQGPERPGYPLEATIQSLFALQVARTPGEVAAVCAGERLTFVELDLRSEGLARVLDRLGVRPGGFVGLLDERGLDFLVALLAVLKAGGAYVPFEPAYPEDRLLYMLANSGVGVLVARAGLIAGRREALSACPELRAVVCLGEEGTELPEVPPGLHAELFDPRAPFTSGEARPALPGDARDSAYMLYTSGSTGLPKGAVVRHDGAVNHIWAQREALSLESGLCFLQSAPSSSDISVWQLLAPQLLGGRTVIVDPETVSDPRRLLRVLREERVTLAELVPAVLRALIDHTAALPAEERALPDLRWMMATGETVPVDLVNDWLALYPQIPVVNAYGPTEAADDVTQAVFDRPLPPGVHALSIGRPLANFSCHVVDRDLRLVPFGAPGELCIAGIGVGSGYWRNPEKTSLSFVPDPFTRTPGAVLYRTGDLVRWRKGDGLEFLGRLDHQVKIRGFRIELGEIEAALREHPAVYDAVAVVRGEGEERSLVAYVAVGETGGLDPAELRDALQARLPGHMVPAAFVPLPHLPRTPNGKVDRRNLPAPEGHAAAAPAADPPRTPVEQKLVEIWSEVFRRDGFGRDTDFFAAGGHSLLAVRMLSRVQAAFNVEIPIRRVFEHPTVAGLAQVVVEAQRTALGRVPPGIQRVARQAERLER